MVDAVTRRSTGKTKGKAGGKNPWLEQLSEETKRQIIFDKLVARAQKPDPEGCFYLHEELEKEESSVEVALELIKWGKDRAAKLNGEGSLPIHVASRNIRQIEPVIFLHLLEAYPNSISTANKVGNLPIHFAAIHAGLDGDLNRRAFNSIEMLIEANPDAVQIGNVEGLLPVHLAISGQRIPSLELIHMLLEPFPEAAGIQDNYGHIPLHKAVSKSRPHIELIEFLVEIFPEGPTIKDKRGFLPLHWAVTRDYPSLEVLSILLAAYPEGVDENDSEGFKPLDRLTVRENYCRDTAAMLLETAAKNYKYKQQQYQQHEIDGRESSVTLL